MAAKKRPTAKRAGDIATAIDALTRREIDGLLFCGYFRLRRAGGMVTASEAKDLLQEAILRTLDGRRTWKPGITFRKHLEECIRSIAHDTVKKAYKSTELLDVHSSEDNPEDAVNAKIETERLMASLRDDAVALSVLESVLNGASPKEAQRALKMNARQYEAARKRISRKSGRLFRPVQGFKHG
jgi:DNA-directed RNA polymerase specialized sigma24 family protein